MEPNPQYGQTEDLVGKAQAGSDEAYDELFSRVASRLELYIQLRLGPGLRSRVDVQDILQETYVEAHRSFARFQIRGPGTFTRWLHRIVDNRIRDLAAHFRTQKRDAGKPPVPLSQAGPVKKSFRRQVSPSSECASQEDQARLLAALEQLEPDEQRVLVLRYFEGHTVDEIAESQGFSRSSAKRMLNRATARVGLFIQQGLPGSVL